MRLNHVKVVDQTGQYQNQKRKRYGGPRKSGLMERSKKELSEFNRRAMDRFDYDKTGIQPVGLPDDPSGVRSRFHSNGCAILYRFLMKKRWLNSLFEEARIWLLMTIVSMKLRSLQKSSFISKRSRPLAPFCSTSTKNRLWPSCNAKSRPTNPS